MLYNFRVRMNKRWFDFMCRGVYALPPAPSLPKGGLKIASMVCHADLTMYILAARSFRSRLGMGEIVVLDDGSLTPADHERIRRYLDPSEIVPIKSVPNGACPKGGCWERINWIARAAKDSYVIQLDSDTLTVAPIPEIAQAVRENRPFLLGTRHGKAVAPIEDMVKLIAGLETAHVQALAEKSFPKLKGYPDLKYARACAGFAGFPRGEDLRARVEDFSLQMEAALGRAKWHSWGSEQVASNFILSNLPGASVLPYPRYSEYNPGDGDKGNAFYHFLGTYRWKNFEYVRRGRAEIAALRASEKAA